MNRKTGFWIALWLILVVVTGVLAFGSGNGSREFGWHHGWNYMDGSPHGYQSETAPGWYGMGSFHGMAGFDMPGIAYGMMSWMQQNMTPEQAKKAGPLLDDAGKNTGKLMQQRIDALSKLSSLFTSDKRDWNAIRAAADELAKLNSLQMNAAIEIQQKMDGLLTDKQRIEMSHAWRSDDKSGDQ